MPWIAEVIADRSGKWAGNALQFATKEDAQAYVSDLACRWTLVTDTRVREIPCSDHRPNESGKVYDIHSRSWVPCPDCSKQITKV